MNAIILVFLDGSNLDVSHRIIEVPQSKEAVTISWWLFGKLEKKSASFLPIEGCGCPGFEWIDPAPVGFTEARVLDKGKRIAIDDTNSAANPPVAGFRYRLRVLFNGEIYETESHKRGKTPVIINK
jgi:hypothetical protein